MTYKGKKWVKTNINFWKEGNASMEKESPDSFRKQHKKTLFKLLLLHMN
jgi:hypothetical protein